MKSHWRTLIGFLPVAQQRKYFGTFFQKEHEAWLAAGKPLPVSNLSKHQALRKLQQQFGLHILVETGTYLGDTLFALSKDFRELYSIELSEHFHTKAKKRFSSMKHIHLLQGDSGKVLKDLVPKLSGPALFWLDGHYSGGLTAKGDKECPVFEELAAIFNSPYQHVICIDDARLFVGKNDYPTMDELTDFIQKIQPGYSISVENDAIRLLPK